MKSAIYLFLAIASCSLCGCSTVPQKLTDQAAVVNDVMTALLPPAFTGDIDITRTDAYMTISLKAKGIRKDDAGRWLWTAVDYHRTTHTPWWSSDVTIKLGTF